MDYDIIFMEKLDNGEIEQQVWEIVCECDTDFIPPLSSRESTYQTTGFDKATTVTNQKPVTYFDTLKKYQHFLIALEKESKEVIGFLSFKHNYESEDLISYSPSNYSTTTCIPKKHRNRGIGKELYLALETKLPDKFRLPFVTRRTWSTNESQIHLFKKMGFELVKLLKDHRGKGIDTVYFAKKLDN